MGGGGMGGGQMMEGGDGEWSDKKKEEAAAANITFLMTAIMNAGFIGLSLFRYRSSTTYYDAGEVLGTNYWKQANQLSSYFWLGAFSLAAFTQLLSMFGIANMINIYVWMLLLEGIGGLVGLVTTVMMLYGYDKAYTVTEDSSSSASDLLNAASVMTAIKDDMIEGTLDSLVTELTLASVGKEWYMSQEAMAMKGQKKEDGPGGMGGPGGQGGPGPQGGQQPPQLFAQFVDYVNF